MADVSNGRFWPILYSIRYTCILFNHNKANLISFFVSVCVCLGKLAKSVHLIYFWPLLASRT